MPSVVVCCALAPRRRHLALPRVALFRRRYITSELVVDGLRQGLDGRGRAKLEQPIADFFGLRGNCIELPPTIGCLQLHDLREVASACQTLG